VQGHCSVGEAFREAEGDEGGNRVKEKLGSRTLKELDNKDIQKQIIEDSDDPEFMKALFDSFNAKRADSLDPTKE